MVIVEGLLLRIWNNPLFLRLINCLLTAGINLLVYAIAKEFFSERAARVMGVCHALFIFPTTYVTVLSNQPYSTFFIYLGLYVFLAKRFDNFHFLVRYFSAALFMAVGNAIRPEAIIFIVSIACCFLFEVLHKVTRTSILAFFKKAGAFLVSYFLLAALFSQLVVWVGINSDGLTNKATLWKFVVGTNYDTSGGYNDDDAALIVQRMEENNWTREEAEASIIKERILVLPVRLGELAKKKVEIFWWDSAYNGILGWQFRYLGEEYPVAVDLAIQLTHMMFLTVFLLAGIGFIQFWKRVRQVNLKAYAIPFVIFATVAVYLVIEIQPRYAYIVHPAVFVLGAGGVEFLHILWKRIQLANPKSVERSADKEPIDREDGRCT